MVITTEKENEAALAIIWEYMQLSDEQIQHLTPEQHQEWDHLLDAVEAFETIAYPLN